MSDDAKQPSPPPTIRSLIFGILRRPLEFGLIGTIIVLVMHLANQADILPIAFKGAGFELEFQKTQTDIVQTVTNNGTIVEQLQEQVAELQNSIKLLNSDIVELAAGGVSVNAATFSRPTGGKQDSANTSLQLVDDVEAIEGNGVIWIGTYDPEAKVWTDSSFLANDLVPPEKLVGADIRLTTNVNVRDGFPRNSEQYFSAVKALGVANKGKKGTVLTEPRVYERGNGVQYWAEVAVTYQPYIGTE